jgi:hypothetical protein
VPSMRAHNVVFIQSFSIALLTPPAQISERPLLYERLLFVCAPQCTFQVEDLLWICVDRSSYGAVH